MGGGQGGGLLTHRIGHALRIRGLGVAGVQVPQPQGHLRHLEQVVQVVHRHGGQVGCGRGQQVTGPAVHLVGQGHVFVGMAEHVHDAVLERLDLVAQHQGLTFLQPHGALAVRVRELHAGQQLGMALEEVGRVGQVVGDVVFGDRGHLRGVAHGRFSEVGNVDGAFKHRGGGAGHAHRAGPCVVGLAGPFDGEHTAMRLHVHFGVEPALADAGDHGGAGTCAAGQGFARAAFVHAQTDLLTRDYLIRATNS